MTLTIPALTVPKPATARPLVDYRGRVMRKPVVSAAALNSQSRLREIRATVAADGSPIPLAYGQCQIGGRVFAIDVTGSTWTVGVAFCLGEIDGYVKLLINGAVPVSGVTVNYYTGTTSQTADPLLAAKISGYADTLVASTPNGSIGIAYCVVQYTSTHYDNLPTFVAEVRGKKIGFGSTNLLTYSQAFDNAAWGHNANGLTISADATVAPDGTTTADKLVETATTTEHRRGYSLTTAGSTSVARRFSFFAKAAERTKARVWSWAGGDTTQQTFDLSAGTCSGTLSPSIDAVGDGWYRCEVTVPATHSTTVAVGPVDDVNVSASPYAGDAAKGIYIWGAQLEVGTAATPYLATTTAPVSSFYSANPAYHLADLLASEIYGQGLDIDGADLMATASYCNETVTSEARRTAGNVLDGVQETEAWAEILRAYASCWIVRRGNTAHLIPDKAAASVQTFTSDDIVSGSLRVTKQDSSNLPTVVRVRYTDTTGTEWREREAIAKRSGVDAGTVPWRESVVSMPGVTRYSQAYREAVERLNKLTLSDLAVEFDTFDEALQREAGDVITLTHFVGLASKQVRIGADPVQVRPGRWQIAATEYDAAAYNDTVENAPSTADGNLPEMGAPAAVTGLTLSEQNFQLQNGDYASRIKASWTASTDTFVTGYQVTVRAGGAVIYSATTRDTEATTPPVQELVAHQVDVSALTPLYIGTAASDSITVVGKTAVPDGPATIGGYEVASEVRLQWTADTSDFDIRRYELRYGATAGSWATAEVLDQVDALTYTTRAIPAGTWRFYVDSIDSIGQYGTTPAYTDIEVTLDDSAYLAHDEDCTSGTPTLTYSAVEEVRGSGVTTFYSDGGDTWATMFGGAAMSTFTNSLASYQTAAGTSEWISAAVDVGASVTGDWLGTIDYIDHNGTATAQLGLSADNVSYTWGNLSQRGTARYAKLRIQSTGIFSVEVPGPNIQLRVIARETNGSGTSSSSAVVTVSTGVPCSAFKMITIVPDSDLQYTWSVSNLVTGATPSFDVSIRNTAGSRVAVAFLWATRTV